MNEMKNSIRYLLQLQTDRDVHHDEFILLFSINLTFHHIKMSNIKYVAKLFVENS